ncbi:hypothetical protein BC938DRAFT_472902 [Jimgerdemannia flammicorona]|uniref:Uncharacterized protein n=1 Tax=Jimgerdemannia flammicorona TaxID=994334 RepID=A0A433Q567_9FUNG|nr:hypothetical protein BC938DRAFT_472902 [Jimgerdemannia flammicorona]
MCVLPCRRVPISCRSARPAGLCQRKPGSQPGKGGYVPVFPSLSEDHHLNFDWGVGSERQN